MKLICWRYLYQKISQGNFSNISADEFYDVEIISEKLELKISAAPASARDKIEKRNEFVF